MEENKRGTTILDLSDDNIIYDILGYCDNSETKLNLILTSKLIYLSISKKLRIAEINKRLFKNITSCKTFYRVYCLKNSVYSDWKFKEDEIKTIDLCKEEINKKNIDIFNVALKLLGNKLKKENGVKVKVLAEVLPLIKLDSFSNLKILKVKSGLKVKNGEKSKERDQRYDEVRKYLEKERKKNNSSGINQTIQIEFDSINIIKNGYLLSSLDDTTEEEETRRYNNLMFMCGDY